MERAGISRSSSSAWRDGGLEVDVPQRRRLVAVGVAGSQQPQEGALGGPLGEPRRSSCTGLHQSTRQPDPAAQRLEGLLVLGRELVAQLDEVRPGDRRRVLRRLGRGGEVGVVGDRRVAADPEVVLDPALGRQAVVVPPDRVEDDLAAHALEAGDEVGLGEREDVPDVQRAATPWAAACRSSRRRPAGWSRRSGTCPTRPIAWPSVSSSPSSCGWSGIRITRPGPSPAASAWPGSGPGPGEPPGRGRVPSRARLRLASD